MKRETDSVNESSLELLLDTICNTFGGVLFIALLVVILLNLSSKTVDWTPPQESEQADLIELQNALEESRQRMAVLQSAIDRQKQIEKNFVEPETRQLVQQWKRKVEEREQNEDAKNSTLANISEAQVKVNEVAKELQNNKDAIARAKEELSAVERQLAQEISTRSRTAKLPKLRQATKFEVPFILSKGRLVSCGRVQNGQVVLNAAEVVQSSSGGNQYLEAKPGAGVAVDPQRPDDQSIAQRFQSFNKGQHYIAVAVSPDSFPHFAAVKDVLVSNGFEYRLIPLTKGEKVSIGASGDARVQ